MTPASSLDPIFPFGMYITDTSYKPRAVVAPDGNIYLFDSTVTLQYAPVDGLLSVDLLSGGQKIASVTYHVDFFYTAK
jgi:hypothetical protein